MSEGSTQREIAESVERTLLEEARRNELRIAYVRTLALALTAAVNFAAYFNPSELGVRTYPLANTLLAGSLAVASVGLIVGFRRRWYRRWVRVAMPIFDAGVVLWLFATTTRRFEAEYLQTSGVLVNMAAVCALLSVSGGLRFSRASAVLTTGLALFIFGLAATMAGFGLIRTAFVASILLGTGFLGVWMNDLVRSTMRGEVARTILARFLPGPVIDDAHESPMSLFTRPRSLDATVLVSDLRGFTSLSESLRPAEALAFLNEVQGRLAEVVRDHGGTVDKFMGDGMLAVFGAPEPRRDHAARALRAARDMLRATARLEAPGGGPVRIGVGLHSGEIVVGCLGSGARLEFTIIGDTVNTASRLESLTKEQGVQILASEEVVRRVGAEERETVPRLEPVGEVPIRGRKRPLALHAVRDGP